MSHEAEPSGDSLSPDEWREAKELFCRVCESSPAVRGSILEAAGPSASVRAAVERLVHAHDSASGFLEDPLSPAPATADAAEPVQKLGPYDLFERLGEGGFGVVYRARQHTPIEREVAVKVLRPGLNTPEMLARFADERRYLARIDHPDIVKVLDAGVTPDGSAFVVMELVDGVPITRHAKSLSIHDRIRLMAHACWAVHAVHQKAIIHRDLKPTNMLVTEQSGETRIRIIDFGIAAAAERTERSGWTLTGAALGTPKYASPEQIAGDWGADIRTDVFALGMVLCEVLTGHLPREPAQGPERPATPPSRLADRGVTPRTDRLLRGDLDRIVLKCVAWDRELRYESAAALAKDLERYLAGLPVLATRPNTAYLARKFVSRHRVGVALALSAAASLAIGLLIALAGQREARRQRDAAEASTQRVAFISNFLLDAMLSTWDPDALGRAPQAGELELETIASRVAGGLEEDPEIMLALLERVGRLQNKTGDPDAAVETLQAAVDFAAGDAGTPTERLIDLRVRLFDIMWNDAESDRFAVIDAALEDAARVYGPDDPRYLRVKQRKPGSTEELERIVLAYEHMPGVDVDDHYSALQALAMRYRFSEAPERQIDLNKRRYELATGHYGPDHSATIAALGEYGEALAAHAPSQEAVDLLTRAYERSTELLGEGHFTTAIMRRSLAYAYGQIDRPAEGIRFALEDERVLREQYGEGSVRHANTLATLGTLYAEAGRNEIAADTLSKAVGYKRTQWSEGHPATVVHEVRLARVLVRLGRFDEAAEFAQAGLEHLDPKRWPAYFTDAALVRVALLRHRGEGDAAAELIHASMEALREAGADASILARLDAALAE